ncbi:hypothetical protein EJD97_015066 [Solanum chilense]|uniref:CCHC-type domain-containing protein n=1 Tax=Solanum chilense TaxID=4083 RepID=A0A6N2C7K0_SOLCI|nr:hypothetical protein EJD97_015066 [Solanum chilense]
MVLRCHKTTSSRVLFIGVMAKTRTNAREEGDGNGEQEVTLEVWNAMLEELRDSMTLSAQANIGEVDPSNTIGGMDATRVREFLNMNPPELYGSEFDEDPNGFIDEVYKSFVAKPRDLMNRFMTNRQTFSEQSYSTASKNEDERLSNDRPQEMINDYSRPTCPRCGKKHEGRCLVGKDGCYGCGESGHMVRDCPKAKDNMIEGKQVATNQVEGGPPKRNRFYALQPKGYQE